MSTRREFLSQGTVATLSTVATGRIAQALTKNGSPSSARTMKQYKIPRTDLTISRIAYGCAMLGLDWNSPDFVARTKPLIRTAYEQGINFFDLADVYGYGKAEVALGEVLRESPHLRSNMVIQSKCGDTFADGSSVNNSRVHIIESAEGSLKRLGTDHLDVLLLHWPDSLVEPEEVAEAFDQLRRSGKVRHFGVSNHGAAQIELLRKYLPMPLVANQIQLGLAHWYVIPQGFKGALTHGTEGVTVLDYCLLSDIQVQAYSPLRADNILKSPNLLNPSPDAPPEVKRAAETLASIATRRGASTSAIMLAWLLRHPAQIVPIIGATRPEHVVESCGADSIELSRQEWYSLLEAAAGMQSSRVI